MNKDLNIRFALIADLDKLAAQAYVSEDIVKRKIENNEFLIAEGAERLFGFVQLEYLWSTVPYIALIRVFSEYRRQGVGKRLLCELEHHLRSKGHEILYSSSQADEEEPQRWHLHVGFEECGVIREVNDGIDEIFFRKIISNS